MVVNLTPQQFLVVYDLVCAEHDKKGHNDIVLSNLKYKLRQIAHYGNVLQTYTDIQQDRPF